MYQPHLNGPCLVYVISQPMHFWEALGVQFQTLYVGSLLVPGCTFYFLTTYRFFVLKLRSPRTHAPTMGACTIPVHQRSN